MSRACSWLHVWAVESTGRALADLSIEDLMNESVSSVSKKETQAFSAAAAIAVVTPDDIRRLGITALPKRVPIVRQKGVDFSFSTSSRCWMDRIPNSRASNPPCWLQYRAA